MATATMIKTPLTAEDRKSVKTMLNAAGEVLVTRAMTKTCRPKYDNRGWNNCWFTQMFGGKANLDRMTASWDARTQSGSSRDSIGNWSQYAYVSTIADKLGIGTDVVNEIIDLFDDASEKEERYDHNTDTVTYGAIHLGKVVSFLEYVVKWLAKRGITFVADLSAHKKA